MNPLDEKEVFDLVGKVNKAVYGINPYEKHEHNFIECDEWTRTCQCGAVEEGDNKYANLKAEDDIFVQEKQD